MSRFDQRYLGSGGFPQALTGPEIERFFTPTPEEKLLILQRRSVPNRIAFALQIGFLKMTGRSLNSVELAPSAVLSHIGAVIGCTPPRIASIRALYQRRRTLFDHQSQARQLLGRREISDHGMRGLTGYLRREAISVYDVADLSDRARVWLVDHGYLLPRERQIRRVVVRSLRHQERVLFDAVCAVVDKSVRQTWPERLLEMAPDGKSSLLEWLQTPPDSHRVRVLDEQLVKLDLLKEAVAPQTVIRGWDGFVRLSASIHDGWLPATSALDQFGSMSEGDPVYATGVAIGKLLRSIYLCDYFANPEFRNGILDLLNQGEAVHSLQRAIRPGPIGPRHGRSPEQMRAISSALTLLTNIVMAWNTHHIQKATDQNPDVLPDNLVAQIAPIRHAHINMRGIISFDIRKVARGLINPDYDLQSRQSKAKPET